MSSNLFYSNYPQPQFKNYPAEYNIPDQLTIKLIHGQEIFDDDLFFKKDTHVIRMLYEKLRKIKFPGKMPLILLNQT